MLKDITLGQYFPGTSVLHRLDPRVKIILTVFYITAVFICSNIFSFVLVTAYTLILILISRIPIKIILKGMKPLLMIIVFTAIINVFWTKGEKLLIEWGIIKIYLEGVIFAVLMILVGFLFSTAVQLIFKDVYTNRWFWVAVKILMVPFICGVGYELLKICGKYDNFVTRIIAAPGLWLQRITTKEPEDSMIEIAIASVMEVLPAAEAEETKETE